MGLWLGLKSFEFQVLKNIQADKAVLVYSVAHIFKETEIWDFLFLSSDFTSFRRVCLLAS